MLDLKALLAKILNALTISEVVTFTKYNKSWTFSRIGRVIYVDAVSDVSGFVPAGLSTIGTLPTSMRPISHIHLGVTNTNLDYRLTINPAGLVQYYQPSATSSAHNAGFSGYSFINGGGYLTSKFYEIFSHLERWWEHVRFKGVAGEGADQSPVVVLQCVRKRLRQLLQGAESWQSCSCLGRILKWLDNHARCLSCVDNIITTIQTTTERQICMWRIGWNARDNRLRRYGWDCVSIYNSNHCILEFHSNLLCGIISERGCFSC